MQSDNTKDDFSEMLNRIPPTDFNTNRVKSQSTDKESTDLSSDIKELVYTLKEQYSQILKRLDDIESAKSSQQGENEQPDETQEDTPENWQFSEESQVYETSFTFDDWPELSVFSDFFQKEEVNWNVYPHKGSFTVSLSADSKETAKEFNDLFTEQEQSLTAESTESSKGDSSPKKKSNDTKPIESDKELDDQDIEEKVTSPMLSSEIKCFEHRNQYLVKIPIARKGSWKHPEYGDMEFTAEYLNNLQRTIDNSELGWEPPLFFGHPTTSGAPSEGYLVSTFREGDTLFGIWSVNSTTYDEIKAGRFRYSSAELIDDYKSKKTGEPVGSVLIGMALTNRPFIPDLHENVALGEYDKPYMFSMELSLDESEINKEDFMTQKEQEVKNNSDQTVQSAKPEVSSSENTNQSYQYSESTDKVEEIKRERDAARQELEQVKDLYQSQLNEAREEINKLKDHVRQREVQEKVARLEQLSIPRKQKDKHIELVKNGSLGSSEEDVIQSLEEMSDSFGSTMLEQHGESQDTTKLNEPNQDPLKQSPHAEAINSLYEQARQRKKQM